MRAVRCLRPGGIEVLQFETVPLPTPRACDVLVRVRAAGVNRGDLVQRMGRYPPPAGVTDVLGLEFAGEVAETKWGWSKGQRVMGILPGGGYAEYAAVHHSHLVPVPDAMSDAVAGGVAEVWMTAFQLCRFVAPLSPQQVVLIHAAASGVGTSLIQLTKAMGAVPVVTCGSDEKLQFCLSLGAESGCNYKLSDFSQWLGRRRADVIFDPVMGSYFSRNAAVISHGGRWVVYGFMGGAEVNCSVGSLLVKRATLLFTTLRGRDDEYKGKLTKAFREERIVERMVEGTLKPVVFKVVDWKDVQAAHAILESNTNIGKVVLTVSYFRFLSRMALSRISRSYMDCGIAFTHSITHALPTGCKSTED